MLLGDPENMIYIMVNHFIPDTVNGDFILPNKIQGEVLYL